jgi:ZIP family zinc transporter
MEVNLWTVLVMATLTAIATGLGALPFFFIRQFSRKWLGIFNSLAAGLMFGASYGLVNEGVTLDLGLLLAGVVSGLLLITWISSKLENDKGGYVDSFKGSGGVKSLLIVAIMTIHSFAEGVGIGVAFGGSETLGLFITAALAIHNIPEGLAISLVLVPRGTPPAKAALWSIFSSIPQPIMAVPAYLLVTVFEPFLPFGLGLAAGAMMWMVFAELVPDALHDLSSQTTAIVVTLAFVGMVALETLL